LRQRLDAKLQKDFAAADDYLAQLARVGVAVNDGTKEWRADGLPFVRGYRRVGAGGQRDAAEIDAMLLERSAARKARDYGTADAILDELALRFGVTVDDVEKTWSTGGHNGGSGAPSPRSPGRETPRGRGSYGQGGGYDDGYGRGEHDYTRAADCSVELDQQDLDEIDELLAERLAFKKQKRFDEADRVQYELRTLGVETDDKRREWRVKY